MSPDQNPRPLPATRHDADGIDRRPIAVITGAYGGMGKACARVLGRRYRLALAARDPARLAAEADALFSAGYEVPVVVSGDVADRDHACRLMEAVARHGQFGALVHTAAIAPKGNDPAAILAINLSSTVQLFDAFLPIAVEGSVALVVSSIAAHMAPFDDRIRGILDMLGSDECLPQLLQCLRDMAGEGGEGAVAQLAYSISKRAVNDLCERRVNDWAAKGARILSLSPGIIRTDMGVNAQAGDPLARKAFEAVAMKRWGSSIEIANAVDFLCSDLASFITGCDLLVDGGFTANARQSQGR